MRIDPKLLVPVTTAEPRDAKAAASRPTDPAEASIVELSSAGAAVSAEPSSKHVAARVAQIRQLLQRGQYPVDLDLLASRIVDDEMMRGGGS